MMMMSTLRPATLDDFWAIPDQDRYHELIDGEIVRKASPSVAHGSAQLLVHSAISPFHRARGGRNGPGGWWFASEAEILLGKDVVRPDLAGWRRDRWPERPDGMPTQARPDWICEILSPSNPTHDTVRKLALYHRAGIPHYWLVDPPAATLTVQRWTPDRYVTAMQAQRRETVRAEPFQEIQIFVGALFGDEPPEAGPP